MSLRTKTPHHVGPLRNKISVNVADDELALIVGQAERHSPPLSSAGMMRQAWLDWSQARGEIVEANEPAVRVFKKRRRA
jgi:hypothetical protein